MLSFLLAISCTLVELNVIDMEDCHIHMYHSVVYSEERKVILEVIKCCDEERTIRHFMFVPTRHEHKRSFQHQRRSQVCQKLLLMTWMVYN
jgi:hypothetical protein